MTSIFISIFFCGVTVGMIACFAMYEIIKRRRDKKENPLKENPLKENPKFRSVDTLINEANLSYEKEMREMRLDMLEKQIMEEQGFFIGPYGMPYPKALLEKKEYTNAETYVLANTNKETV